MIIRIMGIQIPGVMILVSSIDMIIVHGLIAGLQGNLQTKTAD